MMRGAALGNISRPPARAPLLVDLFLIRAVSVSAAQFFSPQSSVFSSSEERWRKLQNLLLVLVVSMCAPAWAGHQALIRPITYSRVLAAAETDTCQVSTHIQ